MCGVAGQVHWQGGVDIPALQRMTYGLGHRGPDDHGLWRSPEGICALGHRRLSIIDLSPLGHQPMIDSATGNALVFNGEIYNYRELRRRCEADGDVFRSDSDTEVILALYRHHGTDCLKYLRGMFAVALWDIGKRRLFLARDRVGKKPLNYAITSQGVVFASEINPLSRHPEVSDATDPEALELYLQLQTVPAPWSIYRQIRKLPPAHFALLDENSFTLHRYWNVDYRQKRSLSEPEALEAFEEKLTEAVRLRMIADVPLGALLSGGIDSSVVVALMTKLAGEPVRTFSVGFDDQAISELPYARQVAERCETLHHPETLEADLERLLPLVARHYGEPYGDRSAVPSFFLSQVAGRHVTVVLNGDGGDELLGGYERYARRSSYLGSSSRLADLLGPRQLVDIMRYFPTISSLPARVRWRLLADLLGPNIGWLMMYTGFWNDHWRLLLLDGRGDPALLPRWRRQWITEAVQNADTPIDRMLWLDNRNYLPDDLLVKMDIAAMHCGLEARSPLLDHEVIEFCASLPVQLKVKRRVGKYLLKKLAEKYFPPAFVHRKKMGFDIPVKHWLLGSLRKHVESIILNPSVMEPLNHDVIRKCWEGLVRGDDDPTNASRIWVLLMYGQWRLLATHE